MARPAPRTPARPACRRRRPASSRIVLGQHVVGDELAARREAAGRRHRLGDRGWRQVHGDAEPADQRGRGGVESRPRPGGAASESDARSAATNVRPSGHRRHLAVAERRGAWPVLSWRGDPPRTRGLRRAGPARYAKESSPAPRTTYCVTPARPSAPSVYRLRQVAWTLGARQHRMRPVKLVVTDQLLGPLPQERRREHIRENPGSPSTIRCAARAAAAVSAVKLGCPSSMTALYDPFRTSYHKKNIPQQ